jgi:hypothetical protein
VPSAISRTRLWSFSARVPCLSVRRVKLACLRSGALNLPMYTAHYIDKDGRAVGDARVGLPRFDTVVAVAKFQFFGRAQPRSNAVGFYILDDAGKEVLRWPAKDDAPPPCLPSI